MPSTWFSPTVSFVVPARNDAELLPRALLSLAIAAAALDETYEIIVVDAESNDDTAVVATLHGAHVVHVPHRPSAASRNSGARAARGQYLVFVDVNTSVSAAVMKAAWTALELGAVGGSATVQIDDHATTRHRLLSAMRRAAQLATRRIAPGFVFCTRMAFDTVGGFDESALDSVTTLGRALKQHGRFTIVAPPVVATPRPEIDDRDNSKLSLPTFLSG